MCERCKIYQCKKLKQKQQKIFSINNSRNNPLTILYNPFFKSSMYKILLFLVIAHTKLVKNNIQPFLKLEIFRPFLIKRRKVSKSVFSGKGARDI